MNPTLAWGQRNKRSLGLDLRSPKGKDVFLDLIAKADVVLTNFKPGTLESLGLGPDVLLDRNPRLVVAQSSAYGSTGPWSTRLGYGPLVRAEAGVTRLWSYQDGSGADGATVYPDHTAARAVATAVLAALLRRDRTGAGGVVDLSQQEVILTQLPVELASPKDGPALEDPIVSRMLACGGDDDWLVASQRDERDRVALAELLGDQAVESWAAARDSAQAAAQLQAAGIPAARMNRARELPGDPHLVARGFLRPMEHPLLDRPLVGESGPARFSNIPPAEARPAPLAGQDSRAVLRSWLDLDESTLDQLVQDGVVQVAAMTEAVR
jgi:crotonobetainyl-CoA:carnitine CoA-transferase CaiB-like acyl-CoA transferase